MDAGTLRFNYGKTLTGYLLTSTDGSNCAEVLDNTLDNLEATDWSSANNLTETGEAKKGFSI